MSEIIAAVLALLLTSIASYLFNRFLKSSKTPGNKATFFIAILVTVVFFVLFLIYGFKSSPITYIFINGTTSTPELTTNVPNGTTTTPAPLFVKQWNINYECQNNAIVSVTGVTISGGLPPYQIIFSQDEKIISSTVDYLLDGKVSFSEPIIVKTGSYVHITIKSSSIDGKPLWNGELFFPPAPPGNCN